MKKELNKKQIKKNLSCDLIFIKNSEEFKSKVCISYVLWQKNNLRLPNKLPRKILMSG